MDAIKDYSGIPSVIDQPSDVFTIKAYNDRLQKTTMQTLEKQCEDNVKVYNEYYDGFVRNLVSAIKEGKSECFFKYNKRDYCSSDYETVEKMLAQETFYRFEREIKAKKFPYKTASKYEDHGKDFEGDHAWYRWDEITIQLK